MRYSQHITFQKNFAVLNRLLMMFYLFVILVEVACGNYQISYHGLYAALAFLVVELIAVQEYSNHSLHLNFLLVFRYTQVIIATVCVVFNSKELFPFFPICFIWLVASIMSFYVLFDIYDVLKRIICLFFVSICLTIVPLIMNSMYLQMEDGYLRIYLLFAGLVIVLSYLSKVFHTFMDSIDQVMLKLNRMLRNEKENNEILRSQQDKVKSANELLGLQKIKLEAAYQKLNRFNVEMMVQNEIIRYIASSMEIANIMDLIIDSILKNMKVEVCAIVLYQGAVNNKKINYRVKGNDELDYIRSLCKSIEKNEIDRYLLEGTYIDNHVVNGVYSFFGFNTVGSVLITPFCKKGVRLGYIMVGHSVYNYFIDNVAFYESISSQFLLAIDNTNLYTKMESMAIRDGLTGIYNRRYLTKVFYETMERAQKDNMNVGVALLDIDKFKNINDTYGHAFGDIVIQTVARLSWQIARKYNGIVGRYGGEEFVIIFPQLSLDRSYVIIKKLHNQIREVKLHHKTGVVQVSVSVGLTAYPESCDNPDELFSRADSAMYCSKERGRDCITIDRNDLDKKKSKK